MIVQTVSEHLTQDFEVMPIGTGAELARLNDQNRAMQLTMACCLPLLNHPAHEQLRRDVLHLLKEANP